MQFGVAIPNFSKLGTRGDVVAVARGPLSQVVKDLGLSRLCLRHRFRAAHVEGRTRAERDPAGVGRVDSGQLDVARCTSPG